MGEAVSNCSTGAGTAAGGGPGSDNADEIVSSEPRATMGRPDSSKSLCPCSTRSLPSVRPDDTPPPPSPIFSWMGGSAPTAPSATFTKLRCRDQIMQIGPDGQRHLRAVLPERHFCAAVRIDLDSIRPFFNFNPQVKSAGGLRLSKGRKGKGPSTMPFTLGEEAEMSVESGGSRQWREGWLHLVYPRTCSQNGGSDSLKGVIEVCFGGGQTGLGECTASLHFEFQCAFEDVVPRGVFRDEDRTIIVAMMLKHRSRLVDIDIDYIDGIVDEAFPSTVSPVVSARIAKTWKEYFRANLMRKTLSNVSEGYGLDSDDESQSRSGMGSS